MLLVKVKLYENYKFVVGRVDCCGVPTVGNVPG